MKAPELDQSDSWRVPVGRLVSFVGLHSSQLVPTGFGPSVLSPFGIRENQRPGASPFLAGGAKA